MFRTHFLASSAFLAILLLFGCTASTQSQADDSHAEIEVEVERVEQQEPEASSEVPQDSAPEPTAEEVTVEAAVEEEVTEPRQGDEVRERVQAEDASMIATLSAAGSEDSSILNEILGMHGDDARSVDEIFAQSQGPGVLDQPEPSDTGVSFLADPDNSAEGGLALSTVRFALRRYERRIVGCFENELADNPELQGSLTLAWEIDAEGGRIAADIELRESTLGNQNVETCVVGVIQPIRFHDSDEGPTRVNYKFTFPAQ